MSIKTVKMAGGGRGKGGGGGGKGEAIREIQLKYC